MAAPLGIGLAILLGSTAAMQVAMLGAMSRQRGAIEAAWVSLLGTLVGLAIVLAIELARGGRLALPVPFERAATFVAIGLVALALLALALRGMAPYYAITGMFAAPYLIGASFLTPRLGIGLFLGSIIAGQLAGAVVLDHVGAFGADPRPVDALRIVGIVALLLGVSLIRGAR